jgi:glycosyltransferase involved in cell wall biosynthesis
MAPVDRRPRISIVTPSFNQARYILETVESVLAQEYPNLEHIVIDGGSTDGTLERLTRYPHLTVVSEPDRGHADAINKGFRLATGDICAFLNSDDTLLSGALSRVAQEMDPGRGRHIVMGRCRFVDEAGRVTGIEHPSHFESHARVLAVWKGHTIPQPAVFWTPEVWRTCGPLDDQLTTAWIDYDLFCRFSRKYRFHTVDQVLATYRLHPESKTGRWTEADRLEESIRLSRRHWGSPLRPLYWRLALSLALFRLDRTGRARRQLRRAQQGWRQGQLLRPAVHSLAGTLLAPEVAFYVGAYPALRDRATGVLKSALQHRARRKVVRPQTAAYLERTEPWPDGWVGPRVVVDRHTESDTHSAEIRGWADLRYMDEPLVLTVQVDNQVVGRHHVGRSGEFTARLPLADPLPPGAHAVAIESSAWFVPHHFARDGDFRPLAWRLAEVELERTAVAP